MRLVRFALAAILSLGGPAVAAPGSDDDLELHDQRRALDSRLESLARHLRDQSSEGQAPRRWAQWYNWGNWSNGFSNWRNW